MAVWGGFSPATSFDCSGYVSWVINNSGWNVGRLTARGLFGITTPVAPSEAKPGDLIFFNYTYNAPQPHLPTHVGIYVGGGILKISIFLILWMKWICCHFLKMM